MLARFFKMSRCQVGPREPYFLLPHRERKQHFGVNFFSSSSSSPSKHFPRRSSPPSERESNAFRHNILCIFYPLLFDRSTSSMTYTSFPPATSLIQRRRALQRRFYFYFFKSGWLKIAREILGSCHLAVTYGIY